MRPSKEAIEAAQHMLDVIVQFGGPDISDVLKAAYDIDFASLRPSKEAMNISPEEARKFWEKIDEAAANAPDVVAATGVIQASVRAALHIRQERDMLRTHAQALAEALEKVKRFVPLYHEDEDYHEKVHKALDEARAALDAARRDGAIK